MAPDPKTTPTTLHTDRPIKSARNDALQRAGFAESIAEQIERAPRGDSYVLGLVGEWGSGKTSILNMIEEYLERAPEFLFLSFNPWLFSGHKELVAHFFHEIAAQIRDKDQGELRDIWRGFEGYSRMLRPLRAIAGSENPSGSESREPSLRRQREVLDAALAKARHRLVVVIDDVDRLEDEEIRDVMKLVRLVADFPNTVYLLSYDEKRVAEALGRKDEKRGYAFLEKIVQVVHPVPRLLPSQRDAFLRSLVEEKCKLARLRPFDGGQLAQAYIRIKDLFRTMRDIHRFGNFLQPTLLAIGEEIAVEDVVMLAALHVSSPEVFHDIAVHASQFTESFTYDTQARDARNAFVLAVFEKWGKDNANCVSICKELFPRVGHIGGGTTYGDSHEPGWHRKGKVAVRKNFEIYLQRAVPNGTVPSRLMRDFIANLEDEGMLRQLFENLKEAELDNFLHRLQDYENTIPADKTEVAIKVVLERIWQSRTGRVFPVDDWTLTIRYDAALKPLLRRITESKRAAIAQREMERAPTLSTKHHIYASMVTRDQSEKLLAEEELTSIKQSLAKLVVQTPAQTLAEEESVGFLLQLALEQDADGAKAKLQEIIGEDNALMILLTRTCAHGIDHQSASLPWWGAFADAIGQETLASRVYALDNKRNELATSDDAQLVLDVALRYARGERSRVEQRQEIVNQKPAQKQPPTPTQPPKPKRKRKPKQAP